MPASGAHPALSIDERLVSLGSTPIDPECCVFKVHHRLRQINVAAYEPDLLAIGPYHHGKDYLSFMEKHKLRFLQRMLKRRDENSAERYITAMNKKEERARRFYADQFPELSKEKFVEMMLIDGCFIIELLRIHRDAIFQVLELSQSVENEPIFQTNWMINGIMRDLLLFENQLPFFILTELFEMSEGCNQQYDYVSERVPTGLLDRALAFFCFTLELSCELNVNGSSYVSDANIKHLLGLIHKAMSPSPKEKKSQRGMKFKETHKSKDLVGPNENEDWMSIPYATDLQDVGVESKQAKKFKDWLFGELKKEEWKPIPNVIELQEAGVKFEKAETGNLFHIKFNNGVMEIPPLNILDNTESVFRNLIAYEQHSQQINLNNVTDFATLMDYFVETE